MKFKNYLSEAKDSQLRDALEQVYEIGHEDGEMGRMMRRKMSVGALGRRLSITLSELLVRPDQIEEVYEAGYLDGKHMKGFKPEKVISKIIKGS